MFSTLPHSNILQLSVDWPNLNLDVLKLSSMQSWKPASDDSEYWLVRYFTMYFKEPCSMALNSQCCKVLVKYGKQCGKYSMSHQLNGRQVAGLFRIRIAYGKIRSIQSECGKRPASLFEKRHWQRCFPVKFAKFLEQLFV